VTYLWIDSQADFEALIDRLRTEPRYALDTEFHRERTYFPKLALMQFATDEETCLVDPLAVDLAPLRRLFASDRWQCCRRTADSMLTHARGAVPSKMYDRSWLRSSRLRTPSLVTFTAGSRCRRQGRSVDRLAAPPVHGRADDHAAPTWTTWLACRINSTSSSSSWAAGMGCRGCEELRHARLGYDPSQAWPDQDVRMLAAGR
jgi:hypothetical protein